MTQSQFADLGISAPVCQALTEIGYETPTSIQAQAIPELLAGHDLLGIAQTGTGKTAAFMLPIIDMLTTRNIKSSSRRPSVLVLAPTRELAAQIRDEASSFARHTRIRNTCIFGGVGQNPQVKALRQGVEVLIATPGRLLDLAQQGHVDFDEITHLVLDEADRLLDVGFIHDIKRIVRMLPEERQSLLFSATMPKEVQELADAILYQPVSINVSPKTITVDKIEQGVLHIGNDRKQAVLQEMLLDGEVSRAIVFTRTKHGANRVAQKLDKAGITAEAIHGNKSQGARTRALDNFKSGKSWVLVATDIAARGIDIDGISHVINFELPHEPESYVHRIGRTARAGTQGVAWSMVDPSEVKRLKAIERFTRKTLPLLDHPDAEHPPQRSSAQNKTQNKDQNREGGEHKPRRRRRSRRRRAA